MKIKDDKVSFVISNRKDSANRGIIGINPELVTYEGYDGIFPCYGNDLTEAERVELADYMIGLWLRYKEVKV